MRTRPVAAVVATAVVALAGALGACSVKEPAPLTALTPSASASAEPSAELSLGKSLGKAASDQGSAAQGTSLGQGGRLTKEQPAAISPDSDPVYTGTVRMTDADGVLSLQGLPDPSPGSGSYSPGPYALLVLDQPQQVVATNSDGQGASSHTASMLLLGHAEQASAWSQYDGQRLSVSHPTSQTFWPSDTSLPLGEPRLSGRATVLTR